MIFHMKTTLIIPDPIFRALKRRAAERNETLSAFVTECLVRGLRDARKPGQPFRVPKFRMGPPKVDIADRDALYSLLDSEGGNRLYGRRRRKG